MKIVLNEKKFQLAHLALLDRMLEKSNGIEFTNFRHPVILNQEIAYKWSIYYEARKVLEINKWNKWINKTGKILEVTKKIFTSEISGVLTEHRYGADKNTDKPLHKLKTEN